MNTISDLLVRFSQMKYQIKGPVEYIIVGLSPFGLSLLLQIYFFASKKTLEKW